MLLKESALKVVVPEAKFMEWWDIRQSKYPEYTETDAQNVWNHCIDKTLSTPLPPVEDCVEMSKDAIVNVLDTFPMLGEMGDVRVIAKDIVANSKSILKWKKEE